MVTIMTALCVSTPPVHDRVSVKPHASPVLHAPQFPDRPPRRREVDELRAFGGLQAIRAEQGSRPGRLLHGLCRDRCHCTLWGALARRYVNAISIPPAPGRQSPWWATRTRRGRDAGKRCSIPHVRHLGEAVWIVDLNRQSLDRVVPTLVGATSCRTCSRRWDGRSSPSSTAAGLRACCARATVRRYEPGSTKMSNVSINGCCAADAAALRERLPGRAGRRAGSTSWSRDLDRRRATTRCCATSAATTCGALRGIRRH